MEQPKRLFIDVNIKYSIDYDMNNIIKRQL